MKRWCWWTRSGQEKGSPKRGLPLSFVWGAIITMPISLPGHRPTLTSGAATRDMDCWNGEE
jgi:hypothetical protein